MLQCIVYMAVLYLLRRRILRTRNRFSLNRLGDLQAKAAHEPRDAFSFLSPSPRILEPFSPKPLNPAE